MLVRGYVTSQNKHGVFIKIGRNLTVRASHRELADLNSQQKQFAKNTIVVGRITNFYKDKVNVSLRESAVQYGVNQITLDDLQEGATIKCQVISQAQGTAFVQIIGSQFRAKLDTANLKLTPGSLVLGKLIKVDQNDPPRINLEGAQPLEEQLSAAQTHLKSLMDSISEIQQVDAEAHPHEEETAEELQLPDVEQNIKDLQDLLEVDEDSDNVEAKNIVDQTVNAAEESEEDEEMPEEESAEEKAAEDKEDSDSESIEEVRTVKKEEKKALGTRV